MRVIITTDAVGGVWQYATTLAQVLCERHAAQVLLVVCGPEPGHERLGSLPLGIRANGGSIELESLFIPLEWDEAATEADLLAGRQALLRLALAWRATCYTSTSITWVPWAARGCRCCWSRTATCAAGTPR